MDTRYIVVQPVYVGMSLQSNILGLVLMIVAGYLCWKCNSKESLPRRIIYTTFASLFSFFYLIYYFIYRILMNRPC